MTKNQIAKRYSKAMVSIFEVGDIPKVLEDLKIFATLIDMDKRLKLLFVSRIFSDEEQDKALKTLLSNIKASKHTEKFLKQIIAQGHLAAIKEIIKTSAGAYNEKLKKTIAQVISPVALEENYVSRLKDVLKTLTQMDVEVESEVDPSLLGGFIIKVGSTVYDSSLKGQLNLLKMELTN